MTANLPDRLALAQALRREYEAGATVRQLCATHHRSYGYVHDLLRLADTTFRPRGGDHRPITEGTTP